MSRSASRQRVMAATAVALLFTGICTACIGLDIEGEREARIVDDGATALAALVATLCCVLAARRDPGRHRRFWWLLGGACVCWTAAEIVWWVYEIALRLAVPVPSWSDVGYLAAIPLAVAALMSHPALSRPSIPKLRSLFDGMIIATALAVLSWTLVIAPVWRSTDVSQVGGLVLLAYPFGDVIIVFFIVVALRRRLGRDMSLWWLLAGLLTMALADSAYSYLSAVNSYFPGGLVDVGWIAAYLMIALSAYTAAPNRKAAERAPGGGATLLSFLTPFIPACVALIVTAIELRLGRHLGNTAVVMIVLLAGLVIVRELLLAVEAVKFGDASDVLWLRTLWRAALGRPPSPDAAPRHRPHPPEAAP